MTVKAFVKRDTMKKGFMALTGPMAAVHKSNGRVCGDRSLDRYFANAKTDEEIAEGIRLCGTCPVLEECREAVSQVDGLVVGVMGGEYHNPLLAWSSAKQRNVIPEFADCGFCGKEFKPRSVHGSWTKTCSKDCRIGKKKKDAEIAREKRVAYIKEHGVPITWTCENPECGAIMTPQVIGSDRWTVTCDRTCHYRKIAIIKEKRLGIYEPDMGIAPMCEERTCITQLTGTQKRFCSKDCAAKHEVWANRETRPRTVRKRFCAMEDCLNVLEISTNKVFCSDECAMVRKNERNRESVRRHRAKKKEG